MRTTNARSSLDLGKLYPGVGDAVDLDVFCIRLIDTTGGRMGICAGVSVVFGGKLGMRYTGGWDLLLLVLLSLATVCSKSVPATAWCG